MLHSIRSSTTAEALKSCVMDMAGPALGADQIGLYFFDSGAVRPSEIYIRHLPESFILKYEQIGREDDRVLTEVLRTQKVAYEKQTFTEDEWRRSLLYRCFSVPYRIRHYLCAPILRDEHIIGTLNLGRACDEVSFDDAAAARCEDVTRAISARLDALADVDGGQGERFARLRAERARLRCEPENVEQRATPLSPAEAASLWSSLAQNQLTPVDSFDRGPRRYVLLRSQDLPQPPPAARLTEREVDVLVRLAAGQTNKAIAFDLAVSVGTVSRHLSTARAKLGVHSRVGMIELVRRLGLGADR
jgi:DNA-binding CsgD family transcriptional regulator